MIQQLVLAKRARLLFVHFCFSSNPKEVKRCKIRTMRRPFELCLQTPNSVSEQCAQMGHSRVCCERVAPSCWNHSNFFWFGVYGWLRSSLIRFNTALWRSPFSVTVLPLPSSNQYGPSISFFAFNAQRAVTFGPFKHLSSISSGLPSPSTNCYGNLQHHSGENGLHQ